ncbi:UNVERIFIED_CONTAM: hypothetical protein PYX00_009853 [Menopon gallinae]|uniref:AMP-dependent synthetase/ligase domain-containing protein n=1 Tax=Menopon gallinae TaxID=328185 RepID=A0AAW2HDC8_9NEOP
MASRAEFLSLIKSWPDKSFINYYLTESSGFTISFSDYKDTIFKLYELWSKIVEEGFQYIGIQLSDFLWLPCLLVVIWKSGKACACIDSQYSEEWNLNFLDTLHVEYLISDSEKSNSSSELLKTFQINTQKFYIWKRNLPTVNKLLKTDLDICYGIMTSGSTGIPKIVQVPWSCILLNIYELISLLSISRSDNVYLCSPYTFDPFFVELFIPLITGCGLTIVSQKLKMVTQSLVTIFFKSKIFIHEEIKECEEINKFICRTGNVVNSNVTVFQMTPSIFRRWGVCNIRDIILSDTSPLRILLLGGEKFPMDLFKLKSKDNVTRVYNIYGITEISCWAFINELSEHCDEVSLGKPLNGIIYKIDENNELYIGSKVRKCIVGFENMEENEVLFRRTGDIVNVKEGTVYYVSRSNQVVKKFGIKVNLEKIERIFSDIHKIGECYCIFDEDTMKIAIFYENSNLEQNHCVVTEKGFSYSGLSSIEVPDHIIEVKALPLNSNGKCDRKSLLELLKSVMVKRVTVDVEKTFKKIWDHFVGCTNFVSGGGDSVKALQIITSLEEAGVNISKDFLLQILKNGDYDVCLKCLNQDSSPETERKKRRLNDGGINELIVLWKFDTRKCIDASPTIFEHNG